MRFIYRIAVVAGLAALTAGCCNCRSYQKKTRRPLVGTEWQLVQLGGETLRPEEGRFTITLSAENGHPPGLRA